LNFYGNSTHSRAAPFSLTLSRTPPLTTGPPLLPGPACQSLLHRVARTPPLSHVHAIAPPPAPADRPALLTAAQGPPLPSSPTLTWTLTLDPPLPLLPAMPFKKGAARCHRALFHPLLRSSLAEHHEPSCPSPLTSRSCQRPHHDHSSLLAGPPLPPRQPRVELHLPGFSTQISLRSSPPLRVRCCKSLSRPRRSPKRLHHP
jgi:hypothetical protein